MVLQLVKNQHVIFKYCITSKMYKILDGFTRFKGENKKVLHQNFQNILKTKIIPKKSDKNCNLEV